MPLEPCAPVIVGDDGGGNGEAGVCAEVVGPPLDTWHHIMVEVVEHGEVAGWASFNGGGAGAGL